MLSNFEKMSSAETFLKSRQASSVSVGQRKVVHRILILGQHQSRCIVLQAVDKIGKCCQRIGKTKKNVKVWTSRISGCQVSAIYQFYCYRT